MKDTIVVTHPGPAHRDEFIACCLLIGDGKTRRIERRAETTEDLVDPRWIVLDQGGRHEPELNNFDHHQFDREADPACSISLILPLFQISQKSARDIWTWFEFSELLDSKGPFETAKRLGSTPDSLRGHQPSRGDRAPLVRGAGGHTPPQPAVGSHGSDRCREARLP